MKKVSGFISVLLVFTLTLFVSCNSNVQQTTSTSEDEEVAQAAKKILDEPLVKQALKQLPEANDLGVFAVVEDSTDVTVLITDLKRGNVDIMFTTILGEESLFLTKRYPNGETLELFFSFKDKIFSVEGSKICSPTDTITLNERDVYKIISNGYQLRTAKKDKLPLIKT